MANAAADALLAAERYLVATGERHASALLALAALRERFQDVAAERDAAASRLDAKRRAYAASLRDVKVVSARMIQEREEEIAELRRRVAAGGGGGGGGGGEGL